MPGDRFLVSARKYRPQTFSELVGQEHVAETLRNALRLNRVAHAYLFCGPRGVGKTSAARILAKAINCETPREQRPDMEPCRNCNSCKSFEEGRSLNVIEIDAASNNGVDDIRALREAVRIPPASGVKKVYIVDEVHMLSKAAFNALLKTLEEPPPFIQFIFATTEPHKLLPTVQSRCQRFDFRRISVSDMVERLRGICEEEGIEADEASLRLIARKGDGALRDAFSTFDQAVILGGEKLVYNEIAEALGAVNIDTYFETTDLIAGRDRAGLLHLVEGLSSNGTDFDEFLSGLTDHLRDLLIAVTTGKTDYIEGDKPTLGRYAEEARRFNEPDLLRHLIIVNEGQEAMKRAVKPRLRLELTLLKMASLERAADLEKIIRQLSSAEVPEEEKKAPAPAKRESTRESRTKGSAPVVETTAPPPTVGKKTDDAPPEKPVSVAKVESSEPPAASPSEELVPSAPAEPSPTPAKARPGQTLFGAPALKKVHEKRSTPKESAENTKPAENSEGRVKMASVQGAWPDYIRDVTTQRIHVGALLQHAKPMSVENDTVSVAVPDEFHERLLGRESDYLSERLCSVMSLDPGVSMRFFVSSEVAAAAEEVEIDPIERVRKLRQGNPIIRALFDDFGGELVW